MRACSSGVSGRCDAAGAVTGCAPTGWLSCPCDGIGDCAPGCGCAPGAGCTRGALAPGVSADIAAAADAGDGCAVELVADDGALTIGTAELFALAASPVTKLR